MEEGKKAGWSLYWYHTERCGSSSELHSYNNACELRVRALLKQANTDSSKMAEVIGVSDAQLRFVTNSQSGMGLLKCGNVVIPFDNQIGKDTALYRLYNTNIHEKIAEEKAKHKNED